MSALTLISLLILLTGCATTNDCEPVFKTVIEYRDRPVQVDPRLTAKLTPITFQPKTWLDVAELAILRAKRIGEYESRLEAIRGLHSE